MSLPNRLPDSIAAEAIEFVIAFLLPHILPRLGDPAAARHLALRLLVAYRPADERDLQLAAEAIGFSIRTLTALSEAADPDAPAEKQDAALRRASSLSRSGLQLQRRLGAQPRAERAPRRVPPPPPFPWAEPSLLPALETGPVAADQPETVSQPDPAASAADEVPVASPVTEAEAKLAKAQRLLDLMRAHWKGAPPPQSKAAQDIQQQQRVVDTARMAVVQARRREADAAATRIDATPAG